MKHPEKNIIWNPKGENENIGFRNIETPEHLAIVKGQDKKLYAINVHEEEKKLYDGKPCFFTDQFYDYPSWMRTEFYGENHINIPLQHKERDSNKKMATLGEILNRINKIEHFFPENTELKITSQWYGIRKDKSSYSLGLKYITKRKFKGFLNSFDVSATPYIDTFEEDKILARFIEFLRQNNFLVAVYPNVAFIFGPDHPGKIANAYGYGLRVGFSEFDISYRGYSNGKENILYDKHDEFDKWSRCNEISKPKSEKDFSGILETLIEHSKK